MRVGIASVVLAVALAAAGLLLWHRSAHRLPPAVPPGGSAAQSSPTRTREQGREELPTPAVGHPSGGGDRASASGRPQPDSYAMPSPAKHGPDETALASIARYADPAVPVPVRVEELKRLAAAADEVSLRTLMAVGDADTYLNFAAVEALGTVKGKPAVDEYLNAKLAAADARVLCAAVRSLAAIEGEKAVPAIGRVLKENRQRPDGYQDDVSAACVESLGAIGSASAVPILKAEFDEVVGITLMYSYGSKVVKALQQIGDPAAQPILMAYADRLDKAAGGMLDNPMGQQYLTGKAKEAREAAAALKR